MDRLISLLFIFSEMVDGFKRRKIVILGSRSVGMHSFNLNNDNSADRLRGKSSLLVQFIENHFVENYYPTIESSVSKSIKLNGVDYDCEIIDTAGQVRSHSYLTAHSLIHCLIFHRTSSRYFTQSMPSASMATS